MVDQPRRQRRKMSVYTLLMLSVLLLSSVPTRPVSAAIIDQVVDDTLLNFTEGEFQRTALSSIEDTNPTLKDNVGAVQLAPAGNLRSWGSTTPLPEAVTEPGVVALGNRLFVIGGSTSATGQGATSAAYWSPINPDNGVPTNPTNPGDSPWQNLDPLAPIQASNDNGCTTPVAARSNAATTAVSSGANTGFIYVMGGSVRPLNCNTDSISSIATQVGVVDSAGRITWSVGPTIPTGNTTGGGVSADQLGIQDAAAVSIRTNTGRVFVYLVGGLRRYQRNGNSGSAIDAELSKEVYFAEANPNTGALNPWQRGPDVPLQAGVEGLSDATAIASSFNVGGGSAVSREGFFVAGGQTNLAGNATADFNSRVYRADIDPNSGAITWDDTPSATGNTPVSLPEARVGMTGIGYNGKIYFIAGQQSPGATLRNSVLYAPLDDSLNVPEVSGLPGTFFVGNENPQPVLQQPRRDSGSAVVPATPTQDEPSAAWVYVAGGLNSSGEPTSSLFAGRIGGTTEADSSSLSPTGWYYSAPVNVQISGVNATVLEVRWSTQINRASAPNADIALEYRTTVTATGLCTEPGIFDASTWTPLDGSGTDGFASVNGRNTVEFPTGVEATCLQYRAFFTQGGSSSPVLLNVSLRKVVPGGPDIRLKELKAEVRNGSLNKDFYVTIENRVGGTPGDERNPAFVQNVDYQNPGNGSFFVDLCISEPNQPLVLPTLPIPGGQIPACSKASAEIQNVQLPRGSELRITNWCTAASSGASVACVPIPDLTTLFGAVGRYEVAVLIDADDVIPEYDAEGEANNVAPTPLLVLNITKASSTNLSLPLVFN